MFYTPTLTINTCPTAWFIQQEILSHQRPNGKGFDDYAPLSACPSILSQRGIYPQWWIKRKFSVPLNSHTSSIMETNSKHIGKQGSRWLNNTHFCRNVLICFGCPNKILQIRYFKQQKFLFSQFGKLESPDQSLAVFSFWREPSSWLADGFLLTESSQGLSSAQTESSVSLPISPSPQSSPYKATCPIMKAPPSWPDLTHVTPQCPHLQRPSQWGLKLQPISWWLELGGRGVWGWGWLI